jgi:FixJ family two-component response regulator
MGSLRVLVADDDDDMRALVAALLHANGFEVLEVRDGEAALDVKMPKFSGLGVLSALRRSAMGLPVILMTALSDASVGTLAKRLGAVAVLRKPFAPEDLLNAMAKARALRGRTSPLA